MAESRELIVRGHRMLFFGMVFDAVNRGGWEDDLGGYVAYTVSALKDLKWSDNEYNRITFNDYFGPDECNRNRICLGVKRNAEEFINGLSDKTVRIVAGQLDGICGSCYSNIHCADIELTEKDRDYQRLYVENVRPCRLKLLDDGTITTGLGTFRDFFRRVPLKKLIFV